MPLLSLNKVWRMRRTCWRLKEIYEDHLKRHSKSRNTIRISVPDPVDNDANFFPDRVAGDWDPVILHEIRSILSNEEEETENGHSISTPMLTPSIHIQLSSARAISNPRLRDFLERYGHQLTQFENLQEQLFPTDTQLELYQQLPNFISP